MPLVFCLILLIIGISEKGSPFIPSWPGTRSIDQVLVAETALFVCLFAWACYGVIGSFHQRRPLVQTQKETDGKRL